MTSEDFENTAEHVKKSFSAVRVKFHLEEIAGDIIDIVSRFHHAVGHFLESFAKQLPIINMLIEAIGNAAAIVNFRKKKTAFEKAALGLKVTAGFITIGITIAAFAVPHVSVPLIIAGSSINLVYNYFSIYKVNYRKKKLEAELKTVPLNNMQERQQIKHKISELDENIDEHKEKIVHKTVSTLTSTIALVGVIIMLANPITVIPVSIMLATTSVLYTCYHFREPIISGFKRLGNAIKNVFTTRSDKVEQEDIESTKLASKPTTDFLNQQQSRLSQYAHEHVDTFSERHQPAPTIAMSKANPAMSDFLHHEEQTLKSISAARLKIGKSIPSIKVTAVDEEDEEGGGESGSGGSPGDLDASREARMEPEFRM